MNLEADFTELHPIASHVLRSSIHISCFTAFIKQGNLKEKHLKQTTAVSLNMTQGIALHWSS